MSGSPPDPLRKTAHVQALPGISYSAGHKTLTVRFDREMESLDPGYYVGGHPPNDVNWCIMPALVHYGYKDGQAVWVPSPHVESVVVTDFPRTSTSRSRRD